MRLRTLALATLVLGCAGKEVRLSSTGEPAPYFGRDAANPEIPKQDSAGFEPAIETVDKPPALIAADEGLAESGGMFRIARHVANSGEVQTVDGTDKFAATLIRARLPKFGEPSKGEFVFYLDHTPDGGVNGARSAKWAVGRVEGRDALMGKLIISGHKIDPGTSVLIPLESLPAAVIEAHTDKP
jgi:hypothetical protein